MAAARETAFVALPGSAAGGKVIASPFQYLTTGEDNLRIVSVNSQFGARLKVNARRYALDGSITSASWDHIPNSDRTVVTTDYPLGVGALLNLSVYASSGNVAIGRTFVIVQIIRGLGAAAIVLGTMLQGYVTGTQHLAWPGSPIESSLAGGGAIITYAGTNPGAGGEFNEVVPSNTRWQVLGLSARYTTTAVVGNRVVNFYFWDGSDPIIVVSASLAQAASQTVTYVWAQNLPRAASAVVNIYNITLPQDYILLAGHEFFSSVSFKDAGDDWDPPRYTVREWLEVL